MPRPASTQPTEAELAILRALWAHGPGRLSEICQWLRPQRKLAASTVAATLGIMRRNGLVRRQQRQGIVTWTARVDRTDAGENMLNDLLDRAGDGKARNLVNQLVERRRLSDVDRRAIGKMLRDDDAKQRNRK